MGKPGLCFEPPPHGQHSLHACAPRGKKPPRTTLRKTAVMAPPANDDPPIAADDEGPHTIVQALGPSKSFGSKSLGEADKTGVQITLYDLTYKIPPPARSAETLDTSSRRIPF